MSVKTVAPNLLNITPQLQNYFLAFLDPNSYTAALKTCTALNKQSQFFGIMDLSNKTLSKETIVDLTEKHKPQGVCLKLSEDTDDDDLLELAIKSGSRIHSLDLTCSTQITFDGLITAAGHLCSLNELVIGKDNLPELSHIPNLHQLTERMPIQALHLSYSDANLSTFRDSTNYSDKGSLKQIPIKSISIKTVHPELIDEIFSIGSQLSNLEKFEFEQFDNEVSHQIRNSIEYLQILPHLNVLSISVGRWGSDDLEAVSKLKKLNSLALFLDRNMDWTILFKNLSHLQLKKLDIGRVSSIREFSAKEIPVLKDFPLEELKFWNVDISACMLSGFSQLPFLTKLTLDFCKIDGSGFQSFANHRRLRILDLTNSSIKNKEFLHFLSSTPLEELNLDRTKISLSSIGKLSPFLRTLNVKGCSIDSVDGLRDSQLTTIEADLHEDGTLLPSLTNIPHLTAAAFFVGPGARKKPGELTEKEWTHIKSLKLHHLTFEGEVSNCALKNFSEMPYLKNLQFTGFATKEFTKDALVHLKNFWHISPKFFFKRVFNLGDLASRQNNRQWLHEPGVMRLLGLNIGIVRLQSSYPVSDLYTRNPHSSDYVKLQARDKRRKGDIWYLEIKGSTFVKCVYKGQLQINDAVKLKPGQIVDITPLFPPTILRTTQAPLPRGQSMYAKVDTIGKKEQISTISVPLARVHPYAWETRLSMPIKSHTFVKNSETSSSPFTSIHIHYNAPKDHTLYLRAKGWPAEQAIPLVPTGPDSWQVHVDPSIKEYKIYLDNRTEELGDFHQVDDETSVCIPNFPEILMLSPPPACTTIQVKYRVPKGHTLFIRAADKKIAMVQVDENLWELRMQNAGPIQVMLDGALGEKTYLPNEGGTNLIVPQFGFEQFIEQV